MTTGSIVDGTVDGLGLGFGAVSDKVTMLLDGTPSGKVEVSIGSQVAYDKANAQYYMGLSSTTWVKLGSVA